MIKNAIMIAALVLLFTGGAVAKNIDLVTLPDREGAQLTIYNSEDITLVREFRFLTLKKGTNDLQFSWSNTLIDPTSVEFRPLEHEGEVEVAHTTFPGQKPQHLIWQIESKFEGQLKVEVSYFISGIRWSMDYVAVTDPEETEMKFDGYVRVYNSSGEEYESAQVRLIVGTINLVEKIAELARRREQAPPPPPAAMEREYKRKAMRDSIKMAEDAEEAADDYATKERQVVKEGLSEYFLFSIEGTETIKNGWSKRMRAVKAENVKFDILYRMRAHQYGARPVRFFLWQNDENYGLGESPLPDGKVRLFRDNGKDGLSFLGEKDLLYVPIKAKIEVNLGPDDLVVYEAVKRSSKRFNFSFYEDRVNGWDEEQNWVAVVRNYRAKPIAFELHRIWDGDVEYYSEVETALFDYRTIEVKFPVKARSKVEYPCTATVHMGVNSKQSSIRLKK